MIIITLLLQFGDHGVSLHAVMQYASQYLLWTPIVFVVYIHAVMVVAKYGVLARKENIGARFIAFSFARNFESAHSYFK
jgi:hypothetical protein